MSLPRYDDLPVTEGMPAGSSWGLWGATDYFGALNLADAEALARGGESVVSGEVFALNWNMELPDPPLFNRASFTHEVTWLDGESGHDDTLHNWNTQSSSQWDGFRHIRHPVHGFYGGVADEDHGIAHWAQRGIATRAVLCDLGRYLEANGRPIDYPSAQLIDPADVLGALSAQGVEVEPGDVLLIRTGWIEWYEQQDAAMRADLAANTRAPGLAPGRETVRMLWDLHVAAVAADNPALEAFPATAFMERERIVELMGEGRFEDFFAHFAIIPLLGIPIGEFFDLSRWANACDKDRRYTGLFTSAPLNLASGVASPPNALVIR